MPTLEWGTGCPGRVPARTMTGTCTVEIGVPAGSEGRHLSYTCHDPIAHVFPGVICLLLLEALKLAKKIFAYSFYLGRKQESIKEIISPKKKYTGEGGMEGGIPPASQKKKIMSSSDLGCSRLSELKMTREGVESKPSVLLVRKQKP